MPGAADFMLAVREAVEVCAKTGRLGDAALTFAKCGIPIFPVDHRNKHPIPKRDPDPTGEYPRGVPKTGGFYKATCDPVVITYWWKINPHALIAMPTGPHTGIWGVDVDTGEEHVSGIDEWNALLAEHEPFETREHRSATGGPHVLFVWEDEQPIGCSKGKGELKDLSLSVKGEGGYIVIPPSVRKGRAYTVFRDIEPIKAPQWLVDQILDDGEGETKTKRQRKSPYPHQPFDGTPQVDLDELAAAMRFVPNDDLSWEEWTSWALAIFAASGGSQRGFDIFDAWSARSSKYDAVITDERWYEISGSPPSATGAGKIFKAARAYGWQPRLPPLPPTYASAADNAGAGRDKMRDIVRGFLSVVDNPEPWQGFSNIEPPPIAHAACIDVGVGKTKITIEELAYWLKQKARAPVVYAVPRHRLGEDILEQFTKYGINARIFRGREADDPLRPGQSMCVNLPAVRLAQSCHAEVGKTCCKYKPKGQEPLYCHFFGHCGYQRQLRDRDGVEVWIVAIDTLFHTQRALGKEITAVIIDESMWMKGLRGVEANEGFDWSVAIDSISNEKPPPTMLIDSYDNLRHRLASALRAHPNNGGVDRKYLDAKNLDSTACSRALGLEWGRYNADIEQLGLHPGMADNCLQAVIDNHDLIDRIQHTRRVIQIWEELRGFLNRADINISGRLTLTQDNGQRTVEWRGIKPISGQFTAPTLLLDATLPPLPMLKLYHERAEIVADIKVALPSSVHIRQLIGAPTGARKLQCERHLAEVRRHILERYLAFNRQLTLVICQQKVDEWLRPKLPDGINIKHYNDVTGLDHFKDVRLLLLIGRTAPGPATTETIAAALTGKCPALTTANGNGFRWFDQIPRGIRLRDGSGVATRGDLHPDPDVEAVRYQICEAELVQALGRGRGVNRTEATPLDADLLFDTALPITVDEVIRWQPPSLLFETAIDGVMLTAPCDLVKLWPQLWPNEKAAYRTLQQTPPTLPGFERVEYQLAGPKMKKRVGFFDLTLIPDPYAWLAQRLGRLI